MENVATLSIDLVKWYFTSVIYPLSLGPITMAATIGAVCLGVGIVLGVRARAARLLWFLVLPAASHVLVAVAAAMPGKFSNDEWLQGGLLVFILAQVSGAAYLSRRLKADRWAAGTLAVFCATYGFFAAFVASMAFSDTWL
ncbi:MAG: hypothetical protein JNJ73_12205 [Hyphomonadaceae bacterium]|nr:hypothetical protein [Hyphomonadaceae bacterium]